MEGRGGTAERWTVDGYWRGGAGRGGAVSRDVEQEGGDGDLRWVA
jgi:hypothetical protein